MLINHLRLDLQTINFYYLSMFYIYIFEKRNKKNWLI